MTFDSIQWQKLSLLEDLPIVRRRHCGVCKLSSDITKPERQSIHFRRGVAKSEKNAPGERVEPRQYSSYQHGRATACKTTHSSADLCRSLDSQSFFNAPIRIAHENRNHYRFSLTDMRLNPRKRLRTGKSDRRGFHHFFAITARQLTITG